MQGHEDHALALALSLFEVLQAFDMGQACQTGARPPPTHRHLEEGNAGGGEVFLEQALALGGGFFRETQFQIALGDAPPVACHPVHQGAQDAADLEQQRVRQLHDQPQQPQAQPQWPETRKKKFGS